jgi:glycosyltransferase involved in cell wall biosynthesis
MPVFNGAKWLTASVESLLGQTRDDFELIISDNGSEDDSAAIAEELARRDGRVRFYRQPRNLGAPANYNFVFQRARGRYFKWASCNDWCAPRFLADCARVLDEHPDVVLSYPRTRLFESGIEESRSYDDNLHLMDASPQVRFQKLLDRISLNNVMNGLIRTAALGRTRLMQNYYASDLNLMAELTLHGKFYEVPEDLFFRRMSPDTATSLQSDEEWQRHYDPELKHTMLFSNWRGNYERFAATLRAPLSFGERLRTLGYVGRRVFWVRALLARDVSQAVAVLAHRLRRARP